MPACAALPVAGRVSSPFGWRWLNGRSDLHSGVDIGAPEGAPVQAVLPGVVVVSAPSGELDGYGQVVVVQHGPALYSLYAHLSARSVVAGAQVAGGQLIGAVGRTAGTRADPAKVFDVSGAHLHMEFLERWPPAGRDQNRIDPAAVLGQLGIIVPAQGPLVLACNDTQLSVVPRPRPSSSGTGAAALAVLGFLAWSRYAARHARRR